MDSDSPILLVDDSMAMRLTIKNILGTLGYKNIELATNGKDAISKIKAAAERNTMFHMILLDWNMPEMDGLEFLKICRGNKALDKVAIVMLTAVSDQKSVLEALTQGATSYIVKPVSAETISKKLEQVKAWLASKGK